MSSTNGIDIAVAGATGAVGREVLGILESRDFPVGELHLLASGRELHRTLAFRGEEHEVGVVDEFDFGRVQLALFSMGGAASLKHSPRAAAAGCLVIDNSSAFRRDDEVPLVVAGVNDHALEERPPAGIVANPNCSTMQIVMALHPLHRHTGIERFYAATYQSVSGAGASGVEELRSQTAAMLGGQRPEPDKFPDLIGFNVIPHIDEFQDNGFTKEEMKIVWESHKILGDPDIAVSATAVRVPVFYGHSAAVQLTTREYLGAPSARHLLAEAPGVTVIDEQRDGGYPTPVTHAAGEDDVFVGRIRDDIWERCGLHLWIVSDNVRKGAALNAVQLAEIVAEQHLR